MKKHEGDILRDYFKTLEKTQDELSEVLGFTRQNLNYHLRKEKLDGDFIRLVKHHFPDAIVENLFYNSTNKESIISEPETVYAKRNIPIYEVKASAGLNFLTENNNITPEGSIQIPHVDVDCFIHVFGDSMYPKYCSGELIGIKRVDKEYVMFGHAYVVQMKDGQVYLKYIRKGKDEIHWLLDNENVKYESKQFSLDKIQSVFLVKTVITKTTI